MTISSCITGALEPLTDKSDGICDFTHINFPVLISIAVTLLSFVLTNIISLRTSDNAITSLDITRCHKTEFDSLSTAVTVSCFVPKYIKLESAIIPENISSSISIEFFILESAEDKI